MNIFIFIISLISTDGLILNETDFNPPKVTVYEHMTASFGVQPEDSIEYSFFPLVLVNPDTGCGNIQNWEELEGAIALTLYGGDCPSFDKAWNIASYGGRGIVVGNNIADEDTLFKMTKLQNENRDVDIPCVLVSKNTYDTARAAIEGARGGTVFASLAQCDHVVSWFPNTIRIVTYLVIVFPSLWAILTIIYCCRRNFNARRQRQQRTRQHKKIPEVLFTKALLTSTPENGSNWVSRNKNSIINDSCAICLEDFKERTKVKLLACGHGYHSKCLAPWIAERSDTCPVCRETVTDKLENDVHVSFCCFKANCFNRGSEIANVEML